MPNSPTLTPNQVQTQSQVGLLSLPPMLFENAYVWTVFLSAMDVILTWLIIFWFQGEEVNGIAAGVIEQWGMAGATVFKFCLILFAIILCEIVGRARRSSGVFLSRVMIAIAAFPVVWSLTLLATNRDVIAPDLTSPDGSHLLGMIMMPGVLG